MLFTFPSRYWFTIGLKGVFSLTGWSRQFHAEFLVLRATQDTATNSHLTCTGLSPSVIQLSRWFQFNASSDVAVLQPPALPKQPGFGLFRVRSPLLAESQLFSLPAGTKMFQFPAYASAWRMPFTRRVVPFGNLRVNGYLRLTEAYRSLSRPSSLSRA